MKLIAHVDGGARGNPGPAAAACVLSEPAGEVIEERAELLGRATNNVAEYRALLLGLDRARALGASDVEVINDSELIAKQVRGIYKVKHPAMRPLHAEAMAALRNFERWSIRTVPRAQNAEADALVNATLDGRVAPVMSSPKAATSSVAGRAEPRDVSHSRRSRAGLAREHLSRAARAIDSGDMVVAVTFLHLASEAAVVSLADRYGVPTERVHWRKAEAATELYERGILADDLAPAMALLNQARKDAGYEGEEPDTGRWTPEDLLALIETAVEAAERGDESGALQAHGKAGPSGQAE